MKFKENKLIGGGHSLKPSHNQDFSLIEAFNNLAPWGEKKFVSEQERTYKFQRGGYCHTEDNSPKYCMVGEILSILRSFAVQTQIFAKECNIIAVGYVRSTAQDDEKLNRLRNKCAMTDYGHAELVSVSCGLNPSPAFQAPSAQGRQGHTHRTALRFPLSPQVARGKIRSVGNMKGNSFTDKVYSLFTTHHSLRKTAFTLAEVLITLGIIGVVSAMTLPTLIESHNRQVVETRLEKFYSTINQAIVRAEVDFGDRSDWYQDTNNIETDENGKPINGSSGVEKWWNTYLAPYVKTVGVDYDNGLPVFEFADGSCLKANQATAMRDWIYYTTSRDRCIKMAGSEENSRGVCSFSFMYVPTADSPYFYKKGFEPYKSGWNGTESGLYNACKKSDNKMDKSLCGALIQYNGWKIPKNYPLKVKY